MNKKSLILCTALALCACSVDRRNSYDPDIKLAFQPAMYMQVDGGKTEDYPQDTPFGISTWLNDDNGAASPLLSDAKVSGGADLWSVDGGKLWPARGTSMSVLAYAPYGRAASCKLEQGVVFSGVDMSKDDTDLLYSDLQSGLEKMTCGGVVSVPFKHALSQVSFRVYDCVEAAEKVVIKSIRMKSVRYKGDFQSRPSPEWNISNETIELEIFSGEQEPKVIPSEIGRSALVIPQALESVVCVDFEYYTIGGTHITQHLESKPLRTSMAPGLRYVYTLGIGIDEIHFQTELIEHHFKKN